MILKTRVIPCLLLMDGRLVKTIQFKNPNYVGDPINIVRIFNTKEVDEIVFLDISATPNHRGPDFELIKEIASECFMPLAYGGGITELDQAKKLFNIGVEKIILNSSAAVNPDLIERLSDKFGSQSIIVSIDIKKNLFGRYHVYTRCGKQKQARSPLDYALAMQAKGAGEILLTSINQDGKMNGYDIAAIKQITSQLAIPVIACGGAGSIADFSQAVKQGGASAVAAGSLVVYQGKNRAVLTKFPKREELALALP